MEEEEDGEDLDYDDEDDDQDFPEYQHPLDNAAPGGSIKISIPFFGSTSNAQTVKEH
jgi:hypothetical protein